MKKNEKKKRTIRDVILIAALLAVTGVLFLVLRASGSGKEIEGPCAVVTIGGEEVGRFPLSEPGTFILNGGTNTLVVQDGVAYMEEAKCPDKICMAMGKISRNGEFIACLPNQLLVVIEDGESSGVDARS